jgi:pimeloyl-ACP methyl ester carboxylesterase
MVEEDFGGTGSPVVLLHGLAGYAREWAQTAEWLALTHRVLALEQRGHGRRGDEIADLSRAAFVTDAAEWLERRGLAPAVVVGQSLGGHTAFLLAARRPELVRAVVVVEATPAADPEAPAVVREWLESWPVPFETRAQAIEFFGGDSLWARTWADGLVARDGGLWPAFRADAMVAALAEVSATSSWDEWSAIRCPICVVRAAKGDNSATYRRMIELQPGARLVEIEGAGHDLHLDQPERWRATLGRFLADLT